METCVNCEQGIHISHPAGMKDGVVQWNWVHDLCGASRCIVDDQFTGTVAVPEKEE